MHNSAHSWRLYSVASPEYQGAPTPSIAFRQIILILSKPLLILFRLGPESTMSNLQNRTAAVQQDTVAVRQLHGLLCIAWSYDLFNLTLSFSSEMAKSQAAIPPYSIARWLQDGRILISVIHTFLTGCRKALRPPCGTPKTALAPCDCHYGGHMMPSRFV